MSARRASRRARATTRADPVRRDAARSSRSTARAGGVAHEVRVKLAPAAGEDGRARRLAAAVGASRSGASSRRSSSRPTASRSSRAGPPCAAPTSTASLGRLFPARAGAAAGLRARRSPSGTRRSAASSSGSRRPRGADAVDGAGRRLGAALVEAAARDARRARAGLRERSSAELGLAGGDARLRGRAADASPRSRRASTPTSRAARPGSGRTSTTSRSPPAAATCAASARRASSGSRVLALLLAEARARSRRDAAAPARRRPLGARRAPPRRPRRARSRALGQTRDHGDARVARCPASRPGRGGDALERLSELGPRRARRASAPQGRLAASSSSAGRRRSARRSRATPGPRGSRRDGTLHVNTADSVWAFELAQRAREIAARLGVRGGPVRAGPARRSRSRERRPEPGPRALAGAGARGGARSPPRSTTKTCAKVSKER